MNLSSSVLELIGNTPAVSLSRLVAQYGLKGKVIAKIEYFNPGLSKKDRIALEMIEHAEKSQILRPGQTVLELTSGNTGTGLAIVCSLKGYKFVAVMSAGNSEERVRMMRAFGAEVVIVPQAPTSIKGQVSGEDLALVEKEAQRLTQEFNAFRADQFSLEANYLAHLKTAEEIWSQSGGTVTAFVDFVGSGGTFLGTSIGLKKRDSSVSCYIVEPAGIAVLAHPAGPNTLKPSHRIQGGGYSMAAEQTQLRHASNSFGDLDVIDGYLSVTDDDAIRISRDLAKHEGIFGGFSGGANVAAALEILRRQDSESSVVACLICDSGLKYLSTDLYR